MSGQGRHRLPTQHHNIQMGFCLAIISLGKEASHQLSLYGPSLERKFLPFVFDCVKWWWDGFSLRRNFPSYDHGCSTQKSLVVTLGAWFMQNCLPGTLSSFTAEVNHPFASFQIRKRVLGNARGWWIRHPPSPSLRLTSSVATSSQGYHCSVLAVRAEEDYLRLRYLSSCSPRDPRLQCVLTARICSQIYVAEVTAAYFSQCMIGKSYLTLHFMRPFRPPVWKMVTSFMAAGRRVYDAVTPTARFEWLSCLQ